METLQSPYRNENTLELELRFFYRIEEVVKETCRREWIDKIPKGDKKQNTKQDKTGRKGLSLHVN